MMCDAMIGRGVYGVCHCMVKWVGLHVGLCKNTSLRRRWNHSNGAHMQNMDGLVWWHDPKAHHSVG